MRESSNACKYYLDYLRISPFSHALWRALEAQAIEDIELSAPRIDIGCGFGEFAGVFCKEMIEIGIDTSKADLALAASSEKYGRLLVADARDLPFQDNSFNSALSISVLEHIVGAEYVFKEVFRILKPGGIFVCTVNSATLQDELVLPAFLRAIGLYSLARAYFDLFCFVFKIESLYNAGEWVEYARSAGFHISRVSGTITRMQLLLYELGLPTALITRLSKYLVGRRLPFESFLRIKILGSLTPRLLNLAVDAKLTDANILIVAEKPS